MQIGQWRLKEETIMRELRASLVRVPLVPALSALEEGGHWLVGGPNLDLLEVGAVVAAVVVVHAVDGRLVHVLPRVSASEHVVDLLAVKMHLAFKLLLDDEHVGTGLAEEAEVGRGLLGQQDVGTRRAEEHIHALINFITF